MDINKIQGCSIPKFHEESHIPDDIERCGPPYGSCTGVTEDHHVLTKQETSCTKKWIKTWWIDCWKNSWNCFINYSMNKTDDESNY